MLKIEIRTENDAFRDPYEIDHTEFRDAELIRIIREQVILGLEYGVTKKNLVDINGNVVGSYEVIN